MRAEGIRGESLAEGYLKSKGYKIIGRNEKLMGIEVDLIATDYFVSLAFKVSFRKAFSPYAFRSHLLSPTKFLMNDFL